MKNMYSSFRLPLILIYMAFFCAPSFLISNLYAGVRSIPIVEEHIDFYHLVSARVADLKLLRPEGLEENESPRIQITLQLHVLVPVGSHVVAAERTISMGGHATRTALNPCDDILRNTFAQGPSSIQNIILSVKKIDSTMGVLGKLNHEAVSINFSYKAIFDKKKSAQELHWIKIYAGKFSGVDHWFLIELDFRNPLALKTNVKGLVAINEVGSVTVLDSENEFVAQSGFYLNAEHDLFWRNEGIVQTESFASGSEYSNVEEMAEALLSQVELTDSEVSNLRIALNDQDKKLPLGILKFVDLVWSDENSVDSVSMIHLENGADRVMIIAGDEDKGWKIIQMLLALQVKHTELKHIQIKAGRLDSENYQNSTR